MPLLFLCLKVFIARIIDVTLGTIKTIYIVKGRTTLSGIIAFIEIFIWFTVAKETLNTSNPSILIAISYSAGYATGTILGTYVSKFINSLITVEVITTKATKTNIEKIRNQGFGVSIVNTTSNYKDEENKSILYITLNSKHLEELKHNISEIDNKAFIVINECKIVQNGYIK